MDLLFLAYADQRKDLPGVEQEANYHSSLLEQGFSWDAFKMLQDRAATPSSLSRRLTTFRDDLFLFHYSGHAGDDILALEEEANARSEGVAHLLSQCPNLKLVILNGCCTAGQVQTMRAHGVKAIIIATNVPVGDSSAFRFSELFYQAFHGGDHIQQAFEQAIGGTKLSQEVEVSRDPGFPNSVSSNTPLWGIFRSEELDPEEIKLPGSRQGKVTPLPAVGYFFGRKTVLKQLGGKINKTQPQAIAITGGPGIGKSSLCLSAMHAPKAARIYGPNRYFVSCDGAESTDQVVSALAKALNIDPGPDLKNRIWARLSKGRFLIAMDNAETPFSHDRETFEAFLRELFGTDRVTLLLTIRGVDLPFGLSWNDSFALKPMPNRDSREIFLATAGVKFRQDPVLNTIISELDGLPLAIVLIAAQAIGEDHLQPLLQRWQELSTTLLKRGGGTHRLNNLEKSIELSLQSRRMGLAGVELFRILSLLPDGIHRDELGQLAPNYGPEGSRSLVIAGLADYIDQRLQMLAPIRSFGEIHYPLPEDRQQHLLEHYCQLAETGDNLGRKGGAQTSQKITVELNNIDKMVSLAISLLPKKGIAAALGFAEYSSFTGLGNRSLLKDAYEKAKELDLEAQQANCLKSLGDLAFIESDNEQARKLFQQAIPLYEQIGSLLGKANCLRSLGSMAFQESDNEQARKLFQQAIPLYEQIGSLLGKANCLQSLGDLAFRESDNEQARKLFQQAIPLYEQIGSLGGKANCLRSLGDLAVRESDNEQARKLFQQAIPLYEQIGDLLGKANCLRSLGRLAFIESDNEQARKLFQQAIPLYEQIGDLLGKANCLQSLGDLAVRESDNEQARKLFQQAIPLYEQIGSLLGKANCLMSLGRLAFIESDNEQARKLFQQAIPLYEQIGDLLGKANCLMRLGGLALQESDHEQARQLLQQAIPFFEKVGNLLGKAACYWYIGDLQLAEGEKRAARKTWEEALKMYRHVGNIHMMLGICSKLVKVTRGKDKQAYQQMERELKERLK